MMKYLNINEEETKKLLSTLFSDNSLIPFIGAGFTSGSTTASGKHVPSGTKFKEIMINAICLHKKYGKDKEDELSKKTFGELSDLFFSETFCPKEDVDRILEENFHKASLSDEKSIFINSIEWPYIYTLNIDDAIENIADYDVALPFDTYLHEKSKKYKTLFKVHGDIKHELRSSDRRIIFRKSDYYASLVENRAMLELIESDYRHKNIIFIGCSLSDEIDLEFLNHTRSIKSIIDTKRIFITSDKINEFDEVRYKNIGINCIIQYSPGDHAAIYKMIDNAYKDSSAKDKSLDNYKKKFENIGKDVKKNRDFLTLGLTKADSGETHSTENFPYYYGSRDVEAKLIEQIKKPSIVILEGRRFSGKTLLAVKTAMNFVDREVFFVESQKTIELSTFNKLIGRNNSIIVIDSNNLDSKKVDLIAQSESTIYKNNTTILIVTNENELHLDGITPPKIQSTIFKLDNKFSSAEIYKINNLAKEVKLPTFTDGKTILDKVINAYFAIGENNIISKLEKTKDLFKIAYFIAIRNKIYGQDLKNIDIEYNSIKKIVNDSRLFISIEKTGFDEIIDHTGFKVTTHSISWATSLLREYYKEMGADWCSETILEILTSLFKKNKREAIELRKFDNLNFVFSKEISGAGKIIYKIYDNLENIEGREPELFVQKAKAYYNMYKERDAIPKLGSILSELSIAETWAKTSNDKSTLRNISHIRVLICLRMFVLGNTSDDHVIKTIDSLKKLIDEHYQNGHVQTLLQQERNAGQMLETFMTQISSSMNIKLLPYKTTLDDIQIYSSKKKI